jgi:hypothetical protein
MYGEKIRLITSKWAFTRILQIYNAFLHQQDSISLEILSVGRKAYMYIYKRNCESPIQPAQSTVKGYASEWVTATGHRDGPKNVLCLRA